MSIVLSGDRYCLVCGRASFLTVHRKCSRKFSARAQSHALAGRGPQHGPSAKVAAVPASSFAAGSTNREAVPVPRGFLTPAASPVGSSSFVASLLDKPSDGDPMLSGQSECGTSSVLHATPHGGA